MTRSLPRVAIFGAIALIGTLTLAVGAAPASAQQGAEILVTANHDDSPTYDVPDGDCTLREAIFAANNDIPVDECAAGDGNDTIILPQDFYTVDFNPFPDEEDENKRGDLDIYELPFIPSGEVGVGLRAAAASQPQADDFALTIEGNGSIVDASGMPSCNVFHILGVPVLIKNLTVQGGGGFQDLEENEFTTDVPEGGGFLVEGDPEAPFEGEQGALVLDNSVVQGNVAEFGGGIYNDAGYVELRNRSIVGAFPTRPDSEGEEEQETPDPLPFGNIALQDGGGIYTVGEPPEGTVLIDNSSVVGNSAGGDGGGIYNDFDLVEIVNQSSVRRNTAGAVPGRGGVEGGNGGGIFSLTEGPTGGETGTLYEEDFDDGTLGAEWSGNETSPAIVTSPSGETYLGSSSTTNTAGGTGGQPLSSENVTLALENLPAHEILRIEFTLYVIRSWDGKAAPDTFDFDVTGADDPQNETSFSNVSGSCQAYPGDQDGASCFAAGTGSSNSNVLGYPACCGETPDTVYRFRYDIAHADPAIDLTWLVGGSGFQNWPDEGWGIDDVEVSIPPGSALFIDQSIVRANTALECQANGGCEGETGNGGGIFSNGHTEITEGSEIGPDNVAEHEGGGIWTGFEQENGQQPETLILEDSTVRENTAGEHGGGIYNAFDRVTLERSTVNDNVAEDGDGGGIWTTGAQDGEPGFEALNSTISGNEARDIPQNNFSGLGGGIYLAGSGEFELHWTTVANNTADVAGGNIGIGIAVPSTRGEIDNSIISGGTPQNCALDDAATLDSLGFNLSDNAGDSSSTGLTSCRLDQPSDITGQNPLLGALRDNEGWTETHELLRGSPAIDSASLDCVEEDQREVLRPQNGDTVPGAICDRGAYEREPVEEVGQQAPQQTEGCDITGTAGPDILVGTILPEEICGLAGDDTIRGAGGNDTIFGNEGDDRLDGGPGDDALNGGAGTDTGDYSTAPGPVNANLSAGTATGVGASTDTLNGLENLIGSPFDDVLVGTGDANVLRGKDGADRFQGGGGDDIVRGAKGNDRGGGAAGDDTLKGGRDTDRLRGGAGADTVTGGQQGDRLRGNKGDDTLRGGGGNDNINGNAGTDDCNGGAGTNTIVGCEP